MMMNDCEQYRHKELPIKIDEYLLNEELGSGRSATVYKTHNALGVPLAIKVFDLTNELAEKSVDLDNELQALKKIGNHPLVARFHCASRETVAVAANGFKFKCSYILLELVQQGQIFDLCQVAPFCEDLTRHCTK